MDKIEAKIQAFIDRKKQALIAKAKKSGIYENFGQNEYMAIQEFAYKQNWQDSTSTTATMAMIDGFHAWCMNFDMDKLRAINKTL